jgi:fido (protein-threonine AMPylation protein)
MGNGMVSVFANPEEIVPAWRELEKKTQAFASARGLTFAQKHAALADIFIEANHIHPFPEGNGRSLQVFMKELAREQGIDLDYSKTRPDEWNRASAISGTHGEVFAENGQKYLVPFPSDPGPIKKIFSEMARPARMPAVSQKSALAQVRARLQDQLDAGKSRDFRASWKKTETPQPSKTPQPEKTEPDIER